MAYFDKPYRADNNWSLPFYNYIFSGKKKVAVEEPATLEVKPVEPEPAPVAPAPGKLLPQYYHNFLLVVNSFYTKLSNR